MTFSDFTQPLIGYGLFCYLLSLILGGFIMRFRNPRMALSTHVTGLGIGTYSLALASVANSIQLSTFYAAIAFWTHAIGNGGLLLSLALAAFWGTSQSTPIAGKGFSASRQREQIVSWAIRIFSLLTLFSSLCVFWGWLAAREKWREGEMVTEA